MAKVIGIGGIFFRAKDPESINAWYREHLGVPVTEDGCAVFPWREDSAPGREQSTIWSAFATDTDYFGDGRQEFMVNYIVDSLDELLTQLRRQGVKVDDRVEESEFGRFGWATDPEGRRIELWEPPKK
jgi:predicted enzyme related to lactoylglutathione lyase